MSNNQKTNSDVFILISIVLIFVVSLLILCCITMALGGDYRGPKPTIRDIAASIVNKTTRVDTVYESCVPDTTFIGNSKIVVSYVVTDTVFMDIDTTYRKIISGNHGFSHMKFELKVADSETIDLFTRRSEPTDPSDPKNYECRPSASSQYTCTLFTK